MPYAFEFEKKLWTANVGNQEMNRNIFEMRGEDFMDNLKIHRTADIYTQYFEIETGTSRHNVGRGHQMLDDIYST